MSPTPSTFIEILRTKLTQINKHTSNSSIVVGSVVVVVIVVVVIVVRVVSVTVVLDVVFNSVISDARLVDSVFGGVDGEKEIGVSGEDSLTTLVRVVPADLYDNKLINIYIISSRVFRVCVVMVVELSPSIKEEVVRVLVVFPHLSAHVIVRQSLYSNIQFFPSRFRQSYSALEQAPLHREQA